MSDATALPGARRGEATATVGMVIFLGAGAMLFAALFFAYAVMRAQAPAWPPAGTAAVPRGALGANTVVLLVASLALRAGVRAARRGATGPALGRARVALALGAAFLVAQALVWRALVSDGAGPASGIYGSVFFAISGFHALHVAGGLVALGALALRRGAGAAEALARRLGVVALYWDFVLAVWAVFFVGAFLR